MRWIIKVTHQDDMALSTSCECIIKEEMLDDELLDFRTLLFERMVKQIEAKLKEKNNG